MKPTTLTRVSLVSESGTFALASNTPYITSAGEVDQADIYSLLNELSRTNQKNPLKVIRIDVAEVPLEVDYMVQCPIDLLTARGITYALAAQLDWRHPIDPRRMAWQDNELKVFRQLGSVEDFESAYSTFEPCKDLATLMAIILKFKVSVKFTERGDLDIFKYGRNHTRKVSEVDLLTEIAREALHASLESGMEIKWDGKVPVSMVTLTVEPEAAVTEGRERTEHTRKDWEIK